MEPKLPPPANTKAVFGGFAHFGTGGVEDKASAVMSRRVESSRL